METDCEGCAGCCIDWRPLAPAGDEDRPERRPPLDDVDGLVPLTRDEVARFVDNGLGDALVPRLFEPTDGDDVVRVDGRDLAAVTGRPVFFVGLRKPPKPVAPFGTEARWLRTCVFLDPATLQCRIHEDEMYPRTCRVYPGHNLELGAETACERVEDAFGGDRLLDDEPPTELPPPLFGPTALGSTVFAYPDPDDLDGVVRRLVEETATPADRARFVGAAVGSRPGSLSVDRERMREAARSVREADSWIGTALREWTGLAAALGRPVDGDPATLAERIEDDRGAPGTPGW